MTNTETVRAFIDAWNANNIDAIVSFPRRRLPSQHSGRTRPCGRKAVEQFIRSLGPMDRVDWQLLSIAENGPKVLTERIDAFVINGRTVSLPVMGTFEIRGGKITAWRDYFDLATYVNQLQPASPG
jgi:limonene-1,2-epoxide hydrolase